MAQVDWGVKDTPINFKKNKKQKQIVHSWKKDARFSWSEKLYFFVSRNVARLSIQRVWPKMIVVCLLKNKKFCIPEKDETVLTC